MEAAFETNPELLILGRSPAVADFFISTSSQLQAVYFPEFPGAGLRFVGAFPGFQPQNFETCLAANSAGFQISGN